MFNLQICMSRSQLEECFINTNKALLYVHMLQCKFVLFIIFSDLQYFIELQLPFDIHNYGYTFCNVLQIMAIGH